ncbi:DUF5672 family protein [uncultured Mucilaginibacter sp.]|uniref:DUF5672 family protein n=1 Tax=uncultured Mucilaginibacter sp. TaxID=797541 RepID=UPI0025F75B62|nr:DUF5672 family protein [uncultured Mucilaginibacter sp.]
MKKVAVVIPFYRELITEHEAIALQQCQKLLSDHPIIAIKPYWLTLPKKAGIVNFTEVKNFDDQYFTGSLGYNRLMLSSEFYEQFLSYEYILIYQLDAFVFSDQLLYWCNQGFDYIGSPWLRNIGHVDFIKALKSRWQYYYHTRYDLQKNGVPSAKQFENRVGNGGFSLRRVKKFLQVTETRRADIDRYLNLVAQKIYEYSEDAFWSIEVNRKSRFLNIPDYKTAVSFGWETQLERARELNNGQLPFGCHAWDRNIDFWAPLFDEFGYELLPKKLVSNFAAETAFDIKYLYRISDGSNPKNKLQTATKLHCLQNFIEIFKHNIYVFADNCSEATLAAIRNLGVEPVEIALGNSKSWRFVVESAIKNFEDESYVYLVEDDYLHLPGSDRALQEGLAIADYVTLYDHPDKYGNPVAGVTEFTEAESHVLLTSSTHWKTVSSTTMTFAAKVKTLKEDKDIWWHFTEGKIPNDHYAFLKLMHKNSEPPKKLFKKLKASLVPAKASNPKRVLISSIPGFSTHAETEWLSPVTAWYNIKAWSEV